MRRRYAWDIWIYPTSGFLQCRHRTTVARYRWRWTAALCRLFFIPRAIRSDGDVWVPGDIYEVHE